MAVSAVDHKRVAFLPWCVFQVVLPLIQIAIGVVVIVMARNRPDPLTLVEGLTLSVFAITILSGVVGVIFSPIGTLVPEKSKTLAVASLCVVTAMSIIIIVLYYTGQIVQRETFVTAQLGMVAIAIPAAWIARS